MASDSFLSGENIDPVLVCVQTAPNLRHKQLTNQEAIAEFRVVLSRLLLEPYSERMIQARQAAGELGLRLRDGEIQRELWRLRMATSGRSEPVLPGQRLDLSPTPWRWEGLLLDRCAHLLVAPPKVGKSSLGLGLVAAWHRGESTFLDRRLIGPCPPVILCWPDQGEQDCARMIRAAGLLAADGGLLSPPLVALFHAGRPIHLDPEGIERLTELVSHHDEPLVILDSYSAATRPLGLEEASAEFAMPLVELIEAIEPYRATLLVIHHAGKARAAESPTSASRGSTALPAAASQVLSLVRVSPQNRADRRLMLAAEGRGGPQEHLLIERQGDDWICHGSGDEAYASQQREQHRQKLTDRQAAGLALVERRWRDGQGETTAVDLVEEPSCDLDGKHAPRLARKVLQALGRMELVTLRHVGGGVSARPWGSADGPDGPPCSAGPAGPAGPQIELEVKSENPGDLWDLGDLSDRGDHADLNDLPTSATADPISKFPRREFTDPAWLQDQAEARGYQLTVGQLRNFKRRHQLPLGQRLSPDARQLLELEQETAKRAKHGEQLERAQALALIAQGATPETAAAVAAVLPSKEDLWKHRQQIGTAWILQAETYLLKRVEALTGKAYNNVSAACKRAAKLAPTAAAAAPTDRFRLLLFWGVILRLDQLEGPPPADPLAFYSWSQLDAYNAHANNARSLDDLLADRMDGCTARYLLQLPETGPLERTAIRNAYRTKARQHHPDAGGDRRHFEQLCAARDRLLRGMG
jgi:hypothetical protein